MPPPTKAKPAKAKSTKAKSTKARPAPRPERVEAYQTGLSAEDDAADYLSAEGFEILARRFRAPGGEIDLVARRGTLLVFVEVKARRSIDDAAWSITPRNRRRIVTAARVWLARHLPDDTQGGIEDMRFDAMLVAPEGAPLHIPGAFEVEDDA